MSDANVNSIEIEKKFLIKNIPNNLSDFENKKILQGYISRSPVIRARQYGDKYFLTVKGSGQLKRTEWEMEISETQFNNLWQKAEDFPVEKQRYLIPLENNFIAELDIYFGVLDGLITCEVEFENEKDAEKFIPPDWFSEDVTFDKRFSNTNLSKLTYEDEKFW